MPHRASHHVTLAVKEALPTRSDPTPSGRTFIFSVDGTRDAEEGLRWVVRTLAKKGDTIHLANVVINPRTPFSGLTRTATSGTWGGQEDAEYMDRVEREASSMLAARFVPIVRAAGIGCATALLRLHAGKSAAAIGELLADAAERLSAGILIIASHGPGVLADYGSVARWCQDHSRVPVMLLPPAVLGGGASGGGTAARGAAPAAAGTAATLLVAGPAGEDLKRLRSAFDFALLRLARPGDAVIVLNVVSAGSGGEEALGNARRELAQAAGEWTDASSARRLAPTLNVSVDVLADASASTSSFDEGGSRAGSALCVLATRTSARALVLLRHGKDLSSELRFAPLTMHAIKHCTRPLIVLEPERHLLVDAAPPAEEQVTNPAIPSGTSSSHASSLAP